MMNQLFSFGTLWRQDDYFEGPYIYVILASMSHSAPIHCLFHTVAYDDLTSPFFIDCGAILTYICSPTEISVLNNNDCPSCGAHEKLEHSVLLCQDHVANRSTLCFAAFQKAGQHSLRLSRNLGPLHLTVHKPIFPRGGRRACQSSFVHLCMWVCVYLCVQSHICNIALTFCFT